MEYAIFIAIILTVLLVYHLIQYKKTKYKTFEYYLRAEVDSIVVDIITLWYVILVIAAAVGVIYLGGLLIKTIIT